MNEIDPQEFGRLVGAVETLVGQVAHMAREIDEIRNVMNRGKGVVIGMLIAAGGLGAGATHILDKLFK